MQMNSAHGHHAARGLCEFPWVVSNSAFEHCFHILDVLYFCARVAFDQNRVGLLARRNGSGPGGFPQKLCAIFCGNVDHFYRREPSPRLAIPRRADLS